MSGPIVFLAEVRRLRRPSALRRDVEAEVEVLARRYAPGGEAEALEAIAVVLERQVHRMTEGRAHVGLWAAAFRRRAALAREQGGREGGPTALDLPHRGS